MLENRRRLSTGPEELAWQLPGAWVWRCRNLRTAGRAATRQERAGSSRYRSRHRGPLCVEQARSTAELEVQRPMVQQSESRHRSERRRRSLLENVACSSREVAQFAWWQRPDGSRVMRATPRPTQEWWTI